MLISIATSYFISMTLCWLISCMSATIIPSLWLSISMLPTVQSIASRWTSSLTRARRSTPSRDATIQYHRPCSPLLVQTTYFTPSSSHRYSHQVQLEVHSFRLKVYSYMSKIVASMFISKFILLYSPKTIVILSRLQVPCKSVSSNDIRLQTVSLYSLHHNLQMHLQVDLLMLFQV